MEIFEPDWLHIKIYIAKTRASAIQVKLESGRNVSRSPSLHCWISLCQTTPISPAYCSSLFRRLGILQVSFCHLLILFDPASGRLQMAIFFNNYWFWCFYPIKEYAFLSLLRTSGNMESSRGCQHKQVYL